MSVIVTHDSVASPAFSVPLMDTSPAIFTILNDDPNANPTNSADNSAAEGSLISIYATGGGLLSQPVQDGGIALLFAEPPYSSVAAPLSVTIGGQPARISYAGVAPFAVNGMLQVNATIPHGIGSGPEAVVLTIGANNNASQQVTVAVK